MGFGPRLADATTADDGGERGLMFIAYQAAIERQFEFIQSQWLGDGNALRLGDDRDPIVAREWNRAARWSCRGVRRSFSTGLPGFVTTLGGGYFLLPGTAGLRALATGAC